MVSAKLFSAIVATAVILSIVAFAQTQTPRPPATQTIAQMVKNNTNFTTLVRLLKKANLTDVLSSPGDFTVFAPDNAAFAKVNATTLANLQNNSTALKTLLLYHVIPRKLFENNFAGNGTLRTVNGLELPYSINGTTLKVDNATVTEADINTTNGVIHVIDSVMMPPANATAAATVSVTAAGGFLGLPGFEVLNAVVGLLAVAYLVIRRRK